MLKNTKTSFGSITKIIHWLLFFLITAQFLLIWQYKAVSDTVEKSQYMLLHKSVGVTILFLTIIFIIWKLNNVKPVPSMIQPHWQHSLAKIVHQLLLILLIVMPLTGYSLSCAAGKVINYFNIFKLPCFLAANSKLAKLFDLIHQNLGFFILALAIVHILAALYHHFILKDQILKRMLPFFKSNSSF